MAHSPVDLSSWSWSQDYNCYYHEDIEGKFTYCDVDGNFLESGEGARKGKGKAAAQATEPPSTTTPSWTWSPDYNCYYHEYSDGKYMYCDADGNPITSGERTHKGKGKASSQVTAPPATTTPSWTWSPDYNCYYYEYSDDKYMYCDVDGNPLDGEDAVDNQLGTSLNKKKKKHRGK